jgi:hypothetical protein
MNNLEFVAVDRFPEPAFSELQREVFSELALGIISCARSTRTAPSPPADAASFRIGAYRAGELVGWSYGWGAASGCFYMANSGVVAAVRRRGVYSHLVGLVLAQATRMGCSLVTSRHLPTNNQVIIAKLRLGFQVSGFEHSEEFGPMVHLAHRLSQQRAA